MKYALYNIKSKELLKEHFPSLTWHVFHQGAFTKNHLRCHGFATAMFTSWLPATRLSPRIKGIFMFGILISYYSVVFLTSKKIELQEIQIRIMQGHFNGSLLQHCFYHFDLLFSSGATSWWIMKININKTYTTSITPRHKS